MGSLLRLLLVLWAVRAHSLGVRLCDVRCLGVVGRPVILRSELGLGRGETLYSITWRVERDRGRPTRILQHLVGKNRTLPSSPYRQRTSLDPHTGTLTLRAFTPRDRGLYSITLTGTDGAEAQDQTRLDVYEPVGSLLVSVTPNWTSDQSNVTLTCHVTGGSDIRVVWDLDDRNVTDWSRLTSREAGLDLYLPSLTVSECGAFTCTAWNLLNTQSIRLYLTDYLDIPQCRSVPGASLRSRSPLLVSVLVCCLLLASAMAFTLTVGKKALKEPRTEV